MPYQTVGAQHAPIAAALSGDNVVVANITKLFDDEKKMRIVVLRYQYTPAAQVVAQWTDSDSNVLSAPKIVNTNGTGGSYCEAGHFKTAPGEDLILNLGDAVLCGGDLTYQYVSKRYD